MIVKMLLSETELLQGCLDQNPRAQHQLYERYAGKMLAVVRRYIRDRDDADDVLAQGFVTVFRYLHQYEGRGPLAGPVVAGASGRPVVAILLLGHRCRAGRQPRQRRRHEQRRVVYNALWRCCGRE